MTRASNANSIITSQPMSRRLNTPIDGYITRFAHRVGGDKAKEVERFTKFAMVGTLGAVVDFGVLNILLLTILTPTIQINVAIATTCAFAAAVLSNFVWNRLWTYPDSRTRSVRRQLALFASVSLVGWLARTVWITVSYAGLGAIVVGLLHSVSPDTVITLETQKALGANVAQLIGVFVVMIWNFFVNRYWTYNDVD